MLQHVISEILLAAYSRSRTEYTCPQFALLDRQHTSGGVMVPSREGVTSQFVNHLL